jgi:hypothetical protein
MTTNILLVQIYNKIFESFKFTIKVQLWILFDHVVVKYFEKKMKFINFYWKILNV